ncbi:hypothetical protein QR680_013577 [Steinernema hermaphroditum]|uniref:Transporter n=1 Tax=Steinernema hermaphroditum TaxID=289476 RepID=A0AA39M2R7_9BILA|nr:hypothetical protein QR680_013577 [Steinernema hermaphroditum]
MCLLTTRHNECPLQGPPDIRPPVRLVSGHVRSQLHCHSWCCLNFSEAKSGSPSVPQECWHRIGYQTVTLTCLVLTTLSYGFLQTTSLWLIVLSRLLCGTFKHTQSTCRSLLGILTKDDQKGQVKALGRFNSMSNLAFIFAPTLAGWANVSLGYRTTFLIGTSAFAVNSVLTALFVPNVRDATESKESKQQSKSWLHPLIAMLDQFRQVDWTKLRVIFGIRLLTTFVMILYRSNFNWFMKERFEADTAMQGYLISWQGLTQFLISFNIGAVVSFIGIPLGRLLYLNCFAFAAVFIGLSFSTSFWLYTFFLTLLNILSCLCRVIVVEMAIVKCKEGRRALGFWMSFSSQGERHSRARSTNVGDGAVDEKSPLQTTAANSDANSLYPPFVTKVGDYVREGDIEYPFEDPFAGGDENKIRGNWSSRADYILSVVGFTFGLGNLWRFPYYLSQQGGLAFMIPYCVMLLLAAMPTLLMELSLGQFISLGAMSIWKVVPLFKGIGIAMIIIACSIAIMYNVVSAWAMFYLVNSLKLTLPWATCGNHWNSQNCSVWNRDIIESCQLQNGTVLLNGTCVPIASLELDNVTTPTPMLSAFRVGNYVMPSLEYFHREVLMLSSGFDVVGQINIQLVICLFVSWIAVFLCLFKGIKSGGKVVYITVIVPYIILLVLIARFLTLPGSLDGLYYFYSPDWDVLYDLRVWGSAAVQVFYSLSTCSGGLITLSSYNRFHNNVFKDVWIISMVDVVTSLFCSTLVFAAIGFMCYEMDISMSQFEFQEGAELVFVVFSESVAKLPVAPLYAVLFFIMLFLIILSSELFIVETVVSSICDEFPERLRRNHRHVLTCVTVAFLILGVPLCCSAAMYWMMLVDYYTGTWPLIIIAFFECMAVCWVYGVDNFLDNIKWMIRFYPPIYLFWKLLWKFVCPAVFLTILAFVWADFHPMRYDDYLFPHWCNWLGWSISFAPLVAIPIAAVYKFCAADGRIAKRWRDLLCPEDDWGPALAVHRAERYPLQIPEARRLFASHLDGSSKQPIMGVMADASPMASEETDALLAPTSPSKQRSQSSLARGVSAGTGSVVRQPATGGSLLPSFDRETAI